MTETVYADDPSELIAAHYAQLWESSTMPAGEINSHLQVEVLDFVRCQGDWLGAVVAPWGIHLILMNGGGSLWGNIPQGQRRYLDLPGATWLFVADGDPDIAVWQYASLTNSLGKVADMQVACLIATDGLRQAAGAEATVGAQAEAPKAPVSRRGFLRRLAGKRD